MRRAILVVSLALGSGAVAAPGPGAQPAPTPAAPLALTWADWVGDWTGNLAWTGCAVDSEKRGAIPIEANDGAIAIDLTAAGGSLEKLSLVEDGAAFVAKEGDVSLRVMRTATALELAVDLDSGCQLRGTLTRPSVGIAACDQLAAWAHIEQQCTKLSRPALENPSRLARQRAVWKKAEGDAKAKLAAQCSARSAKLQAQLVDVGCAPNPDPNGGMRGAECQALRGVSARVQRCSSIPFDVRTTLDQQVIVLVAAMQGADQASIPVVDAQCKRERERQFAIAQQAGCPP